MNSMSSYSVRQRPGNTGPAAALKTHSSQCPVPSSGRGGTPSTSGRGQFTLAPVRAGRLTRQRVFIQAAALQQGGLGLSELLDKDLAEPVLTPRRIMNRQIKSCRSLDSLVDLVQNEVLNFDHQNVSHALSRLAKMFQGRTRGHPHPSHGPAAYNGAARQQQLAELRPALKLLTRRMHQLIRNYDSWDVTLSLWSYAQLGYHDESALRALCEAALSVAPLFKPVDCANAVVAFAYLDYLHTELLRQIVAVVLDNIDDFHPGELCQVLWGFAKLGCHPGTTLLHEVVATVHRSVRQYATQELVLVLWALVRLGHKPGVRFLYDVETTLLQRLPHMAPADLSLSVWTFAHLRYKAVRLLDEVPAAVGLQLRNCSNAELCSLVSGFATAHHYHRVLLDAVAGVVLSRIEMLTHHEVCVVLWTYGTFRHRPSNADFSKQMAATLYSRMPYFVPQGLAMIVKALAQLQWRSEPLLVALMAAAEAKLNAFKPLELSQLLWGLTALDCKDLNIYYSVVRRCIAILKDPQHPHYRTMLHHRVVNSVISSCQQLGYVPWTLIDFAESKGIRVKEPDILCSRDEDDEGMVILPSTSPQAAAAAAAPPPAWRQKDHEDEEEEELEEEDEDVGVSMASDLAAGVRTRQRQRGASGPSDPLLQLQQQQQQREEEDEKKMHEEGDGRELGHGSPWRQQQQQPERRLHLCEQPTPLDQHSPLRIGFPHHNHYLQQHHHNHHHGYGNRHSQGHSHSRSHGYQGSSYQQQQQYEHGDQDDGDGGRGHANEPAAAPKVLFPRPRAPRRLTPGGPSVPASPAAEMEPVAPALPADAADTHMQAPPVSQAQPGRQRPPQRRHLPSPSFSSAADAATLAAAVAPMPLSSPPSRLRQRLDMRGHAASNGINGDHGNGQSVPEAACVALER